MLIGTGKVRPRTGHEGSEVEYRYSSTLSLTSALDVGGWSTRRPGQFIPGKDLHCCGWPQGRSGRVWKISPPLESDPHTSHSVVSHNTD